LGLAFSSYECNALRDATLLGERSQTVGNVIMPWAFIAIAVGPNFQTLSFRSAIDEVAVIAISVRPRDRTVSVRSTLAPTSLEMRSSRPAHGSVAVFNSAVCEGGGNCQLGPIV